MSSSTALHRHRSPRLQQAVDGLCLLFGILAVLGAVGGALYAVASEQVSAREGLTAGGVCSAVALIFLVTPGVLGIAMRWLPATVWCGLAVPLLAILIGGSLYPIYAILSLPFALPLLAVFVVWWFSSAPQASTVQARGVAPVAPTVPQGSYVVTVLGHDHGPYTAEQLVGLVAEGRVGPTTMLTFDGGGPFPASELGLPFRR